MDIEIFANSACQVYYNQEIKLCKVVWVQTPSLSEYKEPFLFLKDFIRKNHFLYFISDITKQGLNSNDHRKWFEKEIIPAVVEFGIRKVAIISNNNLLKKLYYYIMIITLKKSNLPVQFFNNETYAIEWFKSEDNSISL